MICENGNGAWPQIDGMSIISCHQHRLIYKMFDFTVMSVLARVPVFHIANLHYFFLSAT